MFSTFPESQSLHLEWSAPDALRWGSHVKIEVDQLPEELDIDKEL